MTGSPKVLASEALGALEEIWVNLDRKAAKGSRLTMTNIDLDRLGLAMGSLRKIAETPTT